MPIHTRARGRPEARSTRQQPLVVMVTVSMIATLFSVPASAICTDPNACLCGHNVAVRPVSAETPWIVEVKQVLDTDTDCPLTVGQEVELHQMMDPEYEVPNLGLAGSGDPISTYQPGADMGSGDMPVRPDLPTDNDLIASVHCGELFAWYLIVDGDVATCNPIIQQPDRVPPELPLEDAIRANSSDNCGAVVREILPPQECNDVVTTTNASGCSTARGQTQLAPLLLGLLMVARLRRRGDLE